MGYGRCVDVLKVTSEQKVPETVGSAGICVRSLTNTRLWLEDKWDQCAAQRVEVCISTRSVVGKNMEFRENCAVLIHYGHSKARNLRTSLIFAHSEYQSMNK